MGVTHTKSNTPDLLLFQTTSEMLPEMQIDAFETSQFTNLVLLDTLNNQSAFEPQYGILNIDQNELSDTFLSMNSNEPFNSFSMLMNEEVSSTLDLAFTQGVRVQ